MSSNIHAFSPQFQDQNLELLRPFTVPLAPAEISRNPGHLQEFASVIENVIVPRLLMGQVQFNKTAMVKRPQIGNDGVRDFISLTMRDEPDAAVNYVQSLLDDGICFQDILLKLMAPAARELGERWEHDATSFVEVTLGVARMHRILREFDGVPDYMWSQTGAGRRVLLLPVPGEQHTFGLRLVQEFLLRESWAVVNRPVEKIADLSRLVSAEHFDVVGLALSGETWINTMRSAIASVRKHSRNKRVKILIGGHLLAGRPELVDSMDADGYGSDAPATVTLVNSWAQETAGAC